MKNPLYALLDYVGTFFELLFEKYKFVRRATIVWACCIITWAIYVTFNKDLTPDISGSTAAALGTVVGLLATVIALYQWSRKRDDDREKDKVAERVEELENLLRAKGIEQRSSDRDLVSKPPEEL